MSKNLFFLALIITASGLVSPPVALLGGLTVTLFLIGTGLNQRTLKHVGFRPLLQGLVLWIILGASTLALILFTRVHVW